MKTIKNGLVALALVASGCASQSGSLQSFRKLVRSPRPYEEATMQVQIANGRIMAKLYYSPEGYTLNIGQGNPFFINTEEFGDSLSYRSQRLSYQDFDSDGHIDAMATENNLININDSTIDEEYKNLLLSIQQDRVDRVWRWRWG